MSEVYCDWCFFKIPLSPFAKGGTGKDLEWFQHNSCDKKGCRSAGLPPFKKRGARGSKVTTERYDTPIGKDPEYPT